MKENNCTVEGKEFEAFTFQSSLSTRCAALMNNTANKTDTNLRSVLIGFILIRESAVGKRECKVSSFSNLHSLLISSIELVDGDVISRH